MTLRTRRLTFAGASACTLSFLALVVFLPSCNSNGDRGHPLLRNFETDSSLMLEAGRTLALIDVQQELRKRHPELFDEEQWQALDLEARTRDLFDEATRLLYDRTGAVMHNKRNADTFYSSAEETLVWLRTEREKLREDLLATLSAAGGAQATQTP